MYPAAKMEGLLSKQTNAFNNKFTTCFGTHMILEDYINDDGLHINYNTSTNFFLIKILSNLT